MPTSLQPGFHIVPPRPIDKGDPGEEEEAHPAHFGPLGRARLPGFATLTIDPLTDACFSSTLPLHTQWSTSLQRK